MAARLPANHGPRTTDHAPPPGPISDDEALLIAQTIHNFRATGCPVAAAAVEIAACKRLRKFGAELVPQQPRLWELVLA